jgi:hypothetical protein
MPRGGALHGQVADIVLVALDLHLLVERPGVEARGLGEHLVAQRRRHAMALDEVEADVLEGVAQLAREPLQRARLPGEIGRQIQDRDLLVDLAERGGGGEAHGGPPIR